MRESAQILLDSYVRLQGLHISQVLIGTISKKMEQKI